MSKNFKNEDIRNNSQRVKSQLERKSAGLSFDYLNDIVARSAYQPKKMINTQLFQYPVGDNPSNSINMGLMKD